MRTTIVLGLIALCCAAPAAAQSPVTLTFEGQRATGLVEVGPLAAELVIDFEQVTGRNASALTASAMLVPLPPDLALLSRLPHSVRLPQGFPVLLYISAPADGGLSFQGVVTV